MNQLQRQIVRDPPCPELTPEGAQALEQLCFGAHRELPRQCDLLLVFGSAHSLDRLVRVSEQILLSGGAKAVLVTGGVPRFSDYAPRTEPESREILTQLRPERFPSVQVIEESQATNLKENVLFSRALLAERSPSTIITVMKAHSIGRTEATLRAHFPTSKIFHSPYDADFGHGPLSRGTWRLYAPHRARVWGEYLRMKEYSRTGDLVLSSEQQRYLELLSSHFK